MANGERCTTCGYQETEHIQPEYACEGEPPCSAFKSEVRHKKNCPVLGCMGNCAETIKTQEHEREYAALCHAHWRTNAWMLAPDGRLYFIDVGS